MATGTFGDQLRSQLTIRMLQQRPGRIRVRLTAAGWGFMVLIVVGMLLAINFSNNLIFAMVMLLIAILLVGGYQTRANLSGIQCGEWTCEAVFAGDKIYYRLPVSLPKGWPRHGLRVRGAGGHSDAELFLKKGERQDMVLRRPALNRGRIAGGRAWLTSSFPLGLFVARLRTNDLPECLVYPTPQGAEVLPDQKLGSDAHLHSESDNFADLKRYAPGDPLTHISWRAFARFDELYTKEFDGAKGEPARWLRWQDVAAPGTEEKLQQLCRWMLDCQAQGREFGLELPGQMIAPGQGHRHLQECLQLLAESEGGVS